MNESEGLSFLKVQSAPDEGLKSLISPCDSVDAAFTLLDTQFSYKASELRVLKKQICALPMLKENYDYYLTIINRVFLPRKGLRYVRHISFHVELGSYGPSTNNSSKL